MGPLGCVAAVTYRCNARCAMCDIWKLEPKQDSELAPSDYRWLPRSLRSINVSGGEPFLRDDLVEIVSVMREACPEARVVISTNGLMPERVEEMASRMGDVAIRVSVDAVGTAHDELRGIPDAYEKALDTVKRLKALGLSDLGLAATATEDHPGELTRVRQKAAELDLEFAASAAHSSPIFLGEHEGERPHSEGAVSEIAGVMRDLLASSRPKDWAKAYYMRGLIDYVRGKPRRLRCRAGIDFFFLDPWGDVFPCNISGTLMGNIRDGGFAEIQRRTAALVREKVAACPNQCWMICTVAPPMRRRPLGPAAWIAGAKLLKLDTRVDR
jgi:MoaA/NifB/PqqE/SkfB family radical SAM enzyme